MIDLLIYIPTYNRPVSLKRQIATIVSDLKIQHPKLNVKVVIQDNSSSEFIKFKHPNFDIRRNGVNIGGNANIALGFTIDFVAESRFLWVLSDNDFLEDGFLGEVAEAVSEDDVDFIIMDEASDQHHRQTIKCRDYKFIWHKGLISNCIYNTKNLINNGEIPFLFHNSSFPHLAVAFKIINSKKDLRYHIIPKSSVIKSIELGENTGDYSLSHSGMPILLELMHGIFGYKFGIQWLYKSQFSRSKIPKEYHFVYRQSQHILFRKLFILAIIMKYVAMVRQTVKRLKSK